MVKLRFYWDGCATFEDEDEYTEMELIENYEGDSWKECCDDCASCSLDWDDGDLVTGESDCTETSREFGRIEIWDEKKKNTKILHKKLLITTSKQQTNYKNKSLENKKKKKTGKIIV